MSTDAPAAVTLQVHRIAPPPLEDRTSYFDKQVYDLVRRMAPGGLEYTDTIVHTAGAGWQRNFPGLTDGQHGFIGVTEHAKDAEHVARRRAWWKQANDKYAAGSPQPDVLTLLPRDPYRWGLPLAVRWVTPSAPCDSGPLTWSDADPTIAAGPADARQLKQVFGNARDRVGRRTGVLGGVKDDRRPVDLWRLLHEAAQNYRWLHAGTDREQLALQAAATLAVCHLTPGVVHAAFAVREGLAEVQRICGGPSTTDTRDAAALLLDGAAMYVMSPLYRRIADAPPPAVNHG